MIIATFKNQLDIIHVEKITSPEEAYYIVIRYYNDKKIWVSHYRNTLSEAKKIFIQKIRETIFSET